MLEPSDPTDSPDTGLPGAAAAFSHDLIHTYAALISNLQGARDVIDEANMQSEAATDLKECIYKALVQAESQRYDAYNVVAQVAPHLIGELSRPRIERVSLASIIDEMLPLYEQRARMRGIALAVDRESCVSMPPMDCEVFTIQRALHNVLSNAIKYSYRSTSTRHRFVRLWYKLVDPISRQWGIFVQNYGVGILPREASRIFTPGYRGELAIAERTYGCGLGLSEARKCIEAHGGTIRFKSVLATPEQVDPGTASESANEGAVYLTTVRMILPEHTTIRRTTGADAHA